MVVLAVLLFPFESFSHGDCRCYQSLRLTEQLVKSHQCFFSCQADRLVGPTQCQATVFVQTRIHEQRTERVEPCSEDIHVMKERRQAFHDVFRVRAGFEHGHQHVAGFAKLVVVHAAEPAQFME